MPGDTAGLLRVTMPVDRCAIMPAIADRFLTRYRRFIWRQMSDRYVDLVGEGFDMAVRAGSLAVPRWLPCFSSDRIRALCSPTTLPSAPCPQHRWLWRNDCIVFDFGQPRRSLQFTGPEGSVEVEMQGRLKVNNFNALRGACLAGQGIGLLPELLCGDQLASGDLLAVLDSGGCRGGDLRGLPISPSPDTESPRTDQFLDHHFRQLPH